MRTKHQVAFLWLGGIIARLLAVQHANHIYYPDQLFQYTEQAFRLVSGYGIIPWEYADGLRSYAPVLLLVPFQYIAGVVSTLAQVSQIDVFIGLFALVSSLLIPATYTITKITTSKKQAVLASFLAAFWYELIYFSAHTLAEQLISICISVGILISLSTKYKHIGIIPLVIAVIIRPQYTPIALLIFWVIHKHKGLNMKKVIGVVLFTLAAVIYADYRLTLSGAFPLLEYLKITLDPRIGSVFGVEPWYRYLQVLSITSAGLFTVVLLKQSRLPLLKITLGIMLIILSLHPHKQYRLAIPLIPLWLILLSELLISYKHKAGAMVALSLLSFWMYSNAHTLSDFAYPQPLSFTDQAISVSKQLTDSCGIWYQDRVWPLATGLSYVQKNIPIYTNGYPPPKLGNVSHIITTQGAKKINETCSSDDSYTNVRRLTPIDQIL